MREKFQRFRKGDMGVLLDERENIAAFAARPTFVTLPARIDRQRRIRVVMEGAKGLELRPGRAQRQVSADDIDNVVGFPDPFPQRGPIVDHGTTLRA